MNIFQSFERCIFNDLKKSYNDTIDQFIKTTLDIDDIIYNNSYKKHITIKGSPSSGKTFILEYLIEHIIRRLENKVDVELKYIKTIDCYNEKHIFDDIIIFIKNSKKRNTRKMIAIDDYNYFTPLFQSKIKDLIKGHGGIELSIITEPEESPLTIDTRQIIKTVFNNDYLYLCKSTNENEIKIFKHLIEQVGKDNNICKLFNQLKILKFIDFSIVNKTYFYNNIIEYIDVREHIESFIKGSTLLFTILEQKYKNNENIKDVLLLIETIIYDCYRNYENNTIDALLKLCLTIKLKIERLKIENKPINYKLLFKYFILMVRNL